jgi:DNA-binding transcriptional LysR family regulator
MAEGAAFALYSCAKRYAMPKLRYGLLMATPDFNLLVTLDVLLAEGSVARAARRLRLSPSAMSRALARLRETTGDPLLVRAGRGLVPTPRAVELREQVRQLVQDAEAVLRPTEQLQPAQLVRTFTLRTSEGFVECFGPGLIARVGTEAPGVRLCFVQKPDKDSAPLREGAVDLEIGVVGSTAAPELRTQALFRDRFIGVVRGRNHPRPLCRRAAHQRVAARAVQGGDRRGFGAAGLAARHRHHRRRFFDRFGAGPGQ